jgi:hypothetical protein
MSSAPTSALERAAIELVRLHQARARTEALVCLDSSGAAIVDMAVGDPNRVTLTPAMQEHLDAGHNCRLIHSHSSERSLGDSDWAACLADTGIEEIIGVNSSGSVFRGSALDWSGLAPYRGRLDQIGRDVEAKVCPLLPADHPAVYLMADLSWVPSHLVNERLHKKGLVLYSAALSIRDGRLLKNPSVAPLVAAGVAEAARHIP